VTFGPFLNALVLALAPFAFLLAIITTNQVKSKYILKSLHKYLNTLHLKTIKAKKQAKNRQKTKNRA